MPHFLHFDPSIARFVARPVSPVAPEDQCDVRAAITHAAMGPADGVQRELACDRQWVYKERRKASPDAGLVRCLDRK